MSFLYNLGLDLTVRQIGSVLLEPMEGSRLSHLYVGIEEGNLVSQ